MRKYRNFGKLIFIIFSIGVIFLGCKKNNDTDENDINILTSEEKQAIISSYNAIDVLVNNCYTENPTNEYFDELLKDIQSQVMVEETYFDNFTLVVKFEKGGYVFWDFLPIDDEQEKLQKNSITETILKSKGGGNTPTNTNVCIINAHDEEKGFEGTRTIVSFLKTKFNDSGFNNVEIKPGTNASADFMLNNLNNYGVIIFFGHGYNLHSKDYNLTYLQTGEKGDLNNITEKYYPRWKNNERALLTMVGKSDNKYIVISDKAIRVSYQNKSLFPNSLIYLSSCQALKKTETLAKVFIDRGVGVVIGWDEDNCIGRQTSKTLFPLLLDGKTIEESFNSTTLVKYDSYYKSNLIFYPNTDKGKHMRLVENENLPSIDISISNYTSASALVNVTINPSAMGLQPSETISLIGVCYSKSPNPTTSGQAVYQSYNSSTSYDITLPNLSSGSKYYTRGYVRTSSGRDIYSDEINFTTDQGLSGTTWKCTMYDFNTSDCYLNGAVGYMSFTDDRHVTFSASNAGEGTYTFTGTQLKINLGTSEEYIGTLINPQKIFGNGKHFTGNETHTFKWEGIKQ